MVTALKAQDPSPSALVDSLSASLSSRELSSALATLSRIADKRSAITMLGNVRIRVAASGDVTFDATDLNVSATYTARAFAGYTPGSACVPAKQLADIAKGASDATVTLAKVTGHGVRVASGDSSVTLIGASPADFPKLPDATADDLRFASTDPEALADMIDAALPCVCKDETRFHLNGVLIECTGNTTRMVATDGHRLIRLTADVAGPRIPGAILPAKAAKEIAKLLRGADVASWALGKAHLFVRCGAWTVAAKLIDAQFPAYEQVIPKDHAKLATIERKPLVAALKRAKKLYSDGRGSKLTFASGKLVITSDAPDTGTSVQSLPASSEWLDDGGEMSLGVNPGFLLDAIDGMSDRCVTLAMGGELDPIVVRETEDAVSYTVPMSKHVVVVMPMRI